MYCPSCGAQNDADARFCGSCGHDISVVVAAGGGGGGVPTWMLPVAGGVVALAVGVGVTLTVMGDDEPTGEPAGDEAAAKTPEGCDDLGGAWAMTTEVIDAVRLSARGVQGYYEVELTPNDRDGDDTCDLDLQVVKLGYGKPASADKPFNTRRRQVGEGRVQWSPDADEWHGHFEVQADDANARYAISLIRARDEILGVWRNVGAQWSKSKMSGRIHVWRGAQPADGSQPLPTDACVWTCLDTCHLVPDGTGKAALPKCADACSGGDAFPAACPF